MSERTEAQAAGLVRYFTGRPCLRGHVAERTTSDGRCIECGRLKASAQYWSDPEAARQAAKKSRRERPDASAAALKKYRQTNREKVLQAKRQYWQENRDKRIAADSKRRAKKQSAVPIWFGELDAFVWSEAARLCQAREAATGVKWHADHMVPLSGEKVSGLHVANNCQVIPGRLNISKNNRMQYIMPGEWIAAT